MSKKIDLNESNVYDPSTYIPGTRILTVLGENVIPIAEFYAKDKDFFYTIPKNINQKGYDLYVEYMTLYKTPASERSKILNQAGKPKQLFSPEHFFDEIDGVKIVNWDNYRDGDLAMKLFGKNQPYANKKFSRSFEVSSADEAEDLLNDIIDYYNQNVPPGYENYHLTAISFSGGAMAFLLTERN